MSCCVVKCLETSIIVLDINSQSYRIEKTRIRLEHDLQEELHHDYNTSSTSFFDVIKERHSVRTYDETVKISREELTEMLEEAALAPSSSNLQPWRFLVIDSPELKGKAITNRIQSAASR